MEKCPLDGSNINFPVSFDLKFIFEKSLAETINADILAIFARLAVRCESITAGKSKEGSRYGRLSAHVEFISLDQMRTSYAELGKLPYIRGLI